MGENRGPELTAVCSTFAAMAILATVMRVYVRTCIVKAFGWDDILMVLALLSHIMFVACAIGGCYWGTGRHMNILSDKEILNAMRYWWLCYIAYCWAMIISKVSIGLFLLRVTVKRVHKWIIYMAMGLTVLTGLIFFFVTMLQCSPISFFWDKKQTNGWCVDVNVIIGLTFLYSAISIISDFTLAILPFFLIWGLNMSARSKIVLIPILGMACVASVAVVVRLGYVMDFKNPDFLYATVDIAIWSDIEQGLAITAGSLATLRPLFKLLSSRFGFSETGGTPFGPSKPSGMRTPQPWNGLRSNESSKKPGIRSFTDSLFRTERASDKDEDYGMGDLRPIRLRDDLDEEHATQKTDNGFNTWRIQASKVSDEECQPGAITMHKQVYQQTDRR